MGKWSHYKGQFPEKQIVEEEKRKQYEELTTEELEYKVCFLDRNGKHLEKMKTDNQAELEAATNVLLQRWEENGNTQQVKRDKLGMLSRVDDIYASVSDLNSFKTWAEQNNMQSIVKETVNAKTLTSAIKDLLVDGNPIPDGVGVFMKSRIRASQPKIKEKS